ncbi:MAG TPA: winged helix-turn-helix domain-containing protein, partial [Chthoniobacterales bacterium]|nr:winged helix-turn-helix domain-containing protein [Chthoniobacterales bacterium]
MLSQFSPHDPAPATPLRRVRFGAFELDATSGELRSTETADPGQTTVLREQVFQVFLMLLERKGAIVTREEIKSRLWGDDTVVDFDRGINTTIQTLRRSLGDSADEPLYIETLARRGYRLRVPIEYLESEPGTALEKDREEHQNASTLNIIDPTRSQRPTRLRWLASVMLLVLVGVVSASWRFFRPAGPPKPQRIVLAVLPFENLTGDPNKEYLADGLTEETISQLSRLNPELLGVIARTSVMGYKRKDTRLDQIGRDLSVQYVLENSLRESGDHLRLTAQLIQVKDQTHLWSQDYEYPAKDILKVQDEVAKAVAGEIKLRLTWQQQAALSQPHPVSPEAFDAYLQGHYFFERNTDRDTDMAAKYYERATQLDPSYAPAWVGLSRTRKWQAVRGLMPREQGYRLAREAAEKALSLNPSLAEAHNQMGRIQQQIDFDWASADASFQKAAALEPNKPESMRLAASSAVNLGRFDNALSLAHRAVDLDPLNAANWELLGETKFFMGQPDQAIGDLKKAVELNPDLWNGHIFLSQAYIIEGRPQDALPEIERVRIESFRLSLRAIAYYALGRKKESDASLTELVAKDQATSAYLVAGVYAFRNEPDEAFEWLDRAYAVHNDGLIEMKVDPFLKNLRSNPRYAAFLKKLN